MRKWFRRAPRGPGKPSASPTLCRGECCAGLGVEGLAAVGADPGSDIGSSDPVVAGPLSLVSVLFASGNWGRRRVTASGNPFIRVIASFYTQIWCIRRVLASGNEGLQGKVTHHRGGDAQSSYLVHFRR